MSLLTIVGCSSESSNNDNEYVEVTGENSYAIKVTLYSGGNSLERYRLYIE